MLSGHSSPGLSLVNFCLFLQIQLGSGDFFSSDLGGAKGPRHTLRKGAPSCLGKGHVITPLLQIGKLRLEGREVEKPGCQDNWLLFMSFSFHH